MIDDLIGAMEKMVETGKKLPQSEREAFKSKFMMIFAPKESSLDKVGPALYGTDSDKLDGHDGSWYQNADNINAGTLNADRFSAYSDLVAENKLGPGSAQVPYGNHTHAPNGGGDPVWSFDGAIAAVTGIARYIVPRAGTLSAVYLACKNKGTAGSTIIDVHKNGTTIFTTQANRPTLAYNDADGWAKGTPDVLSLAEGDVLSLDIDQAATGADGLAVVPAIDFTYLTGRPAPALFAIDGDLYVQQGNLRLTNVTGESRTILKVYLSVGIAPTGAAIIVDIHKNGTTIFTNQANRPQIAAGAYSGYTTQIDVPTLADGEYLTMDIDQVGSGAKGAHLVVHVLFA